MSSAQPVEASPAEREEHHRRQERRRRVDALIDVYQPVLLAALDGDLAWDHTFPEGNTGHVIGVPDAARIAARAVAEHVDQEQRGAGMTTDPEPTHTTATAGEIQAAALAAIRDQNPAFTGLTDAQILDQIAADAMRALNREWERIVDHITDDPEPTHTTAEKFAILAEFAAKIPPETFGVTELDRLRTERDNLAAENARLREALAELVTLKYGPHNADYERRKPLAWQAARQALAGQATQPAETAPAGSECSE